MNDKPLERVKRQKKKAEKQSFTDEQT